MTINEKKCYITDSYHGAFFKLSDDNNLIVAKNIDDATTFSVHEAQLRIGSGKKSRFYTILEIADQLEPADLVMSKKVHVAHDDEPTMFDTLQNNWEQKLKELYFMSSHMGEYQNRLNQMLSDVDKEICDILHFMEFNNPDDAKMLEAAKMLQERRRHRREIKDEMEKTTLMRDTFLDRTFGVKVFQSLELMERMKSRIYTPRKLGTLFTPQINNTVA